MTLEAFRLGRPEIALVYRFAQRLSAVELPWPLAERA